MKTMIKYITIIAIAILSITSFSSCEHKDLCYHHPHKTRLKIEFNWEKAPDAYAKGMCVYFYAVDGSSYRRFDFSNAEGGYVEINEGVYNVIVYNNDTEGVLFKNTKSYDSHHLYTREGNILENLYGSTAQSAPRAKGSEDERVVITPDMMWGCAVTQVEVTLTGTHYEHETITGDMDAPQLKVDNTPEDVILTFYPEDMLCAYTYEIRNVKNIEEVKLACASLSGMSGGMTISNGELSKECITLPIPATCDIKEKRITGGFYTFGHHEDNTKEHRMLLYVVNQDEEKFYYGDPVDEDKRGENYKDLFNVTEQIDTAPNKRRVHIIIDSLTIKSHINEDYVPTVDDWINENHDIIM